MLKWSGDQCLCGVEISVDVEWRSLFMSDGDQC